MTSLVSLCRTELETVSFYLKKNPLERKLYLSGGFFALCAWRRTFLAG